MKYIRNLCICQRQEIDFNTQNVPLTKLMHHEIFEIKKPQQTQQKQTTPNKTKKQRNKQRKPRTPTPDKTRLLLQALLWTFMS